MFIYLNNSLHIGVDQNFCNRKGAVQKMKFQITSNETDKNQLAFFNKGPSCHIRFLYEFREIFHFF